MVADEANLETAACQVGYESPSQFSREYSRMFGCLLGSMLRRLQALRPEIQPSQIGVSSMICTVEQV